MVFERRAVLAATVIEIRENVMLSLADDARSPLENAGQPFGRIR